MNLHRETKRVLFVAGGLATVMLMMFITGMLYLFPVIRLHVWAAFGDSDAMMKLGAITLDLSWVEKACDAGNSEGCWAIWNVYQTSNKQKAFEYLKKGAALELKQRKSYECLLELSRVYEYGLLNQSRNLAEAEKITKQWAEIERNLRAKGRVL